MALLSAITKAVDELVQLGYPREVAERIASGDLPMDTASRMQRAVEQGYDPQVFYHGTNRNVLNFDRGLSKSEGDAIFASDMPFIAKGYAQGEGANLMPLLIKSDFVERGKPIPANFDEMSEDQQFAFLDKVDRFNDRIDRSDYVDRAIAGAGGKDVVIRNLVDPAYYDPLFNDPSDIAAIVNPQNIRSRLSAAFDPEYKGSNILGGAATAAVGAGLLAAPEEAEAGLLGKGASEIRDAFDTKLYRGAQKGVEEFGLNQAGILFATPNKRVAEDFAIAPDRQVYSLLAAPGRFWSPTKSEDVNALLSKIDTDKLYSEYTDPKITGSASDYYKEVGKSETIEEFIEGLNIGAYQSLEMPSALQALRDAGYDSFRVGEEGQLNDLNYGFFDASRVKIAPTIGGGVGLGLLGMPQESVAETAARIRAESDTSGAYAPRSGLLQDVTMAARDLERRLEGSPASLLFPSGYVQHLEEFNRPYERSTYTGALLGALDFL